MSIPPKCKKCNDNKHIWDSKLQGWVRCECLIRNQMDNAQQLAGIDPVYRNLFFDSLKDRLQDDKPKALKRISSLVASLPDRAAFSSKLICVISKYSPSSADRISSVILNHCIKEGYSPRTIGLPEMISLLMSNKGDTNAPSAYSVWEVDLLRIMCGFENKNKIAGQYIYSVCQTRRCHAKPTILTMQRMDYNLIKDMYGSDVLDMIQSPEQSFVVKV